MPSFEDIHNQAAKDNASYAIFCCLRLVLLNDYLVSHSNLIMNYIVNMSNDAEYFNFLHILKQLHSEKILDIADIIPFIDDYLNIYK